MIIQTCFKSIEVLERETVITIIDKTVTYLDTEHRLCPYQSSMGGIPH